MIVADVVARNDYTGDGSSVLFPYSFAIVDEAHLEVLADGVALTLNSDYTVSGVGDEGGGNVTMALAPVSNVKICILRKQPFSQQSVYQQNEDFPAKRIEKDLNKLTMLTQQLRESVARALKFTKKSLLSEPVLPDGEVDKILAWATTNTLKNISSTVFVAGSTTLPLSVANGGTNAATAAAARTSLAAAGLADENIFTARQHWAKGADVASANALAPGTVGNYFLVTGTTTITSIGSKQAGSLLVLEFAGILTVTHNATTLILRDGANMTTAAGDMLILISKGSGNWAELGRRQATVGSTLRGYISGLTMTNDAIDVTNDIDFAIGEAVSDDASISNRVLLNAGAMVKRLDATWAAGTNQGGLAAADNLTGAKTLHAWIFRRSTGVDDYFFSTSLAPTVPGSGTKKRYIGSIIWDGSKVAPFVQDGDYFWWQTPTLDVDATNPGAAAVTRTLNIPTGISMLALLTAELIVGATGGLAYLSDLSTVDLAPSATVAPLGQLSAVASTERSTVEVQVRTSTSSTIRSRLSASDASSILRVVTRGWRDNRGKDG